MDPIPVPKPKSVRNPGRLASSLLLAQAQHLHQAERSLPLQYHSSTFVKGIRTEGEAAQYIREVTEAIHAAHEEAEAQRTRKVFKRKHVITTAAVADVGAKPKRRSVRKGKKSPAKRGRKR